MSDRSHTFDPTTSLRRSGVVSVILSLSLIAADFVTWGPVSTWLWRVTVEDPVEQRFGFDTERVAVNGNIFLVVSKAEPDGVFARAGIEPGYAFTNDGCAWFGRMGGWYGALDRSSLPRSIPMQTAPGDPTSVHVSHLRPDQPLQRTP